MVRFTCLVGLLLLAAIVANAEDETAPDTDREFDRGSGIEPVALSAEQVAHLVRLGKVWGFLKYHHPGVTEGELHWDYELFRVMRRILRADDRTTANNIMFDWAAGLGEIAECDPCAEPPPDAHLRPDLDWIRDREALGVELSAYLEGVYRNRHAEGAQHYVSLVPGVSNASFSNEKGYGELENVDAGYRILGLFRFWNIIQYWFPYRDVMDEDWDAVLAEFVRRFVDAKSHDRYSLEMLAVVVRAHDGHANLWRSLEVRPPRGNCQLPVRLRFVEERVVVVGYAHAEEGPATGLKIGDVVLGFEGKPVEALVESWMPWYAGSNMAARRRGIAGAMTRGDCGEVRLHGERADDLFELKAERIPRDRLEQGSPWSHDLPGETFRLLSDDVAYLKLSSVRMAEAANYIERARETKGLIIDIRNYPSEFVVFALGQHLVDEPTPFARFTFGDLANPGTFVWTEPLVLQPGKPHYAGKVVIMVDETSQSQAEYTAMAFRIGSEAIVLGSTTAGADGNVSPIALPGGLSTMISGIGVFYPDKTPTQRVGIVPDVEVRPTIRGVREARDEALEEALRQILGDDAGEDQIRRMATGADPLPRPKASD